MCQNEVVSLVNIVEFLWIKSIVLLTKTLLNENPLGALAARSFLRKKLVKQKLHLVCDTF